MLSTTSCSSVSRSVRPTAAPPCASATIGVLRCGGVASARQVLRGLVECSQPDGDGSSATRQDGHQSAVRPGSPPSHAVPPRPKFSSDTPVVIRRGTPHHPAPLPRPTTTAPSPVLRPRGWLACCGTGWHCRVAEGGRTARERSADLAQVREQVAADLRAKDMQVPRCVLPRGRRRSWAHRWLIAAKGSDRRVEE